MQRYEIQGPLTGNELNKVNHNFQVLWNMRNVLQTQINDLVLQEGNSPLEVRQARDGEPALNDRLNKFDSQLAQKASRNEVNAISNQLDNLIAHAGSTDGNAELLDIRVGWDGFIYPTAGDAVRSIQQFMTEADEEWVM